MRHVASLQQDGLVCLFDLSTMEEEESLMSVKNSESSVVRKVLKTVAFNLKVKQA